MAISELRIALTVDDYDNASPSIGMAWGWSLATFGLVLSGLKSLEAEKLC